MLFAWNYSVNESVAIILAGEDVLEGDGTGGRESTFGSVLGNGGVCGIYHIDVIEALDGLDVRPGVGAVRFLHRFSHRWRAWRPALRARNFREYKLELLEAEVLWQTGSGASGRYRCVIRSMFSLRAIQPRTHSHALMLKDFWGPSHSAESGDHGLLIVTTRRPKYAQTEVVMGSGAIIPALAASAAILALCILSILNVDILAHLLDHANTVIGVDVVGSPEGNGTAMPKTDWTACSELVS